MAWKVLPHGPLDQLTDSLWHLEGDVPRLPLGRHMVVMRRADGSLLIHNAIACDDETMAAIDALGPVAVIVVPSAFHRIDGGRFAERYPTARVLTPAAGAAKVKKRMRVDGDIMELVDDGVVKAVALPGVRKEVMLLHTDRDGHQTAVFNDILFNLPRSLPGVLGLVARLVGALGGPKVTPGDRLLLVQDKARLRDFFLELAANEMLVRVVPGHGALISGEPCGPAQDALERVANSLR